MKSIEVTRALIGQVAAAAGNGSEQEVVTFISRPLWLKFVVELGGSPSQMPTEWKGLNKTWRVYGSETHVFESEQEIAISMRRP